MKVANNHDRQHAANMRARYVPRLSALEQHAAKMRERNDWLIRLRERAKAQPRAADGFKFSKPDGSYVPRPTLKKPATSVLRVNSFKDTPLKVGIKASVEKIEAEHPHLAGHLDELGRRPTMTWKEFEREKGGAA